MMVTDAEVMVVEDEYIVAMDVQESLKNMGYKVPAVASSGEQAIQKAEEVRPDLVLMDINLSGEMDGIAAAREIQGRLKIPVVYLTGFANGQTLQRAKETNPYGYIIKPFDEDEVHAVIEMAVHKHRMEMEQERLRTLGTMASGVAHDLNNAIAPIVGFSDLLLMYPESLDDRDRTKEYLRTINTAARDAANIVSRLSEFYRHRQPSDEMVSVDLKRVVAEAISLTQPRWKDMAQASGIDINVRTELSKDLPSIRGNEASLRTALTNVIFNAMEAMPKGGTLTIFARRDEQQVLLGVSDTGIGMTEDVRRRALEPFFTTKGEHGSGLGLAMVYGIIERHGGKVEMKSGPGEGTTVVFRLPVLTEQRQAAEAEPAREPLSGLHVLVAEDEPRMRTLLSEYLRRDEHIVEIVVNGREALEKFRQGSYDLVITDRGMPEMNGDHLAAAIKSSAADTPIIMLTGFGEMMATTGERPPGVDFILHKPVTFASLRQALATVVKES